MSKIVIEQWRPTARQKLRHQGEFQDNYFDFVSLHHSDHDGVVRIFVGHSEVVKRLLIIYLHYAAQFFPYQECNICYLDSPSYPLIVKMASQLRIPQAHIHRALAKAPQLRSLVLSNIKPTGKKLGEGSYGCVEELDFNGLLCAGKKIYDT